MRARLIVNPSSGADRGITLLRLINARLRTIADDVDVTLTTSEEDVVRAAARAVEDGCSAVYVGGGDGTLNAALRGLHAASGTGRLPAVGVIPLGTGNDFAKALDLGEDPESALDVLLERRVLDVDVGVVNDRPFINVSAGGFVADVSSEVTEGLKDATGKLAYLIGGARALFGSEPFTAQIDGAPFGSEPLSVSMFAVCNARLIGGGYRIAPGAVIDDGLLDVFIVRAVPFLEFMGVLQQLATGEGHASPSVLHFRSAGFDVRFSRAVRVNTDGEVLEAEACAYRVLHRGVPFFCGPRPHASGTPRTLVIK